LAAREVTVREQPAERTRSTFAAPLPADAAALPAARTTPSTMSHSSSSRALDFAIHSPSGFGKGLAMRTQL
jgi:hypothetical protein